jgi:glycosyltransferase involved in cell wall biosynthesis
MYGDALKILAVANIDITRGGGVLRAIRSIKWYVKNKVRVDLLIPLSDIFYAHSELKDLKALGVSIAGVFKISSITSHAPIFKKTLSDIENILFRRVDFLKLSYKYSPDAVVSFHESTDFVVTAYILSKLFHSKSVSLLQLPPFYGLKRRAENIVRSWFLWNYYMKSLSSSSNIKSKLSVDLIKASNLINREIKYNFYKRLDMLIAVSPSIPLEMNVKWNNMVILDPGLTLDREDQILINKIIKESPIKNRIVLYSARISPEKGLIEALYAFRIMSKKTSRSQTFHHRKT